MATPTIRDELADVFGVEPDSEEFDAKVDKLAELLSRRKPASARYFLADELARVARGDVAGLDSPSKH